MTDKIVFPRTVKDSSVSLSSAAVYTELKFMFL